MASKCESFNKKDKVLGPGEVGDYAADWFLSAPAWNSGKNLFFNLVSSKNRKTSRPQPAARLGLRAPGTLGMPVNPGLHLLPLFTN